jgi:hypothetical protein
MPVPGIWCEVYDAGYMMCKATFRVSEMMRVCGALPIIGPRKSGDKSPHSKKAPQPFIRIDGNQYASP